MPKSAAIRRDLESRVGNPRANWSQSGLDLLNQRVAGNRALEAFFPSRNSLMKPALSFTAHAKAEETFRCFWKSLDDQPCDLFEGIQPIDPLIGNCNVRQGADVVGVYIGCAVEKVQSSLQFSHLCIHAAEVVDGDIKVRGSIQGCMKLLSG